MKLVSQLQVFIGAIIYIQHEACNASSKLSTIEKYGEIPPEIRKFHKTNQ